MDTKDKIKAITKFLFSQESKLSYVEKDGQKQLSPFFDYEISSECREVGFSKCIEVDNVDEAYYILEKTTVNTDSETLRNGLNERIKKAGVDERKSFYMIYKGNLKDKFSSKKG